MDPKTLKGHWALVTGASSGIGYEFAQQLAHRGMNLVVVARRETRLQELANRLSAAHGIEVRVLARDLSEPNVAAEIHRTLTEQGICLRMLVNNAGFAPWGSMEQLDSQAYEAMVQLLVATPIALCRHFFNDLSSHRPGVVINLSSQAALQPIPYLAAYGAAKTALHNFSLALHQEWASKHVYVQTLIPPATDTEIDEVGRAYPTSVNAERRPASEVVHTSLRALAGQAPLVSSARGIFMQKAFGALAPTRVSLRHLAKMFRPPPGR